MKTNIQIITVSACIGLAALAVGVSAQTDDAKTDTHRTRANAKVCQANSLPDACTQAEVDAAVAAAAAATPARVLPGGTIYATRAAFKDGVAVRRYLDEEDAKQLNEDASMLTREFVNASKAKRTEACAVFGKVC
mgnify:FL=1